MRLGRSILVLSMLATGASFAVAEVYRLNSRLDLNIQLEPLPNWPAHEGPLADPGFGKLVGDHRFLVHPEGLRETYALRQTDNRGNFGTWWGNFMPRERVLYTDSPVLGGTWVFKIQTPGGFERAKVSGFGLQIQTKENGPFRAQIRGFDADANAWSQWFNYEGNSTRLADGSAIFIGVGSTSRNLSSVQVRAISSQNVAWGWFGVNAPSIALEPGPGSPARAAP